MATYFATSRIFLLSCSLFEFNRLDDIASVPVCTPSKHHLRNMYKESGIISLAFSRVSSLTSSGLVFKSLVCFISSLNKRGFLVLFPCEELEKAGTYNTSSLKYKAVLIGIFSMWYPVPGTYFDMSHDPSQLGSGQADDGQLLPGT